MQNPFLKSKTEIIATNLTAKHKKCQVCNTIFQYKKRNTKYCSNACKCYAYQHRIKKGLQKAPERPIFIQGNHEQDTHEKILQLEDYIQKLHDEVNYANEKSTWIIQYLENHIKEINKLYRDALQAQSEHIEMIKKNNDYLIGLIQQLTTDKTTEKHEAQMISAISEIASKLIK